MMKITKSKVFEVISLDFCKKYQIKIKAWWIMIYGLSFVKNIWSNNNGGVKVNKDRETRKNKHIFLQENDSITEKDYYEHIF